MRAVLGLALCSFLAACGGGRESTQAPPATSPRDDIPLGGGVYKVGNPYEIKGVRYVPREDPNYTERGIASWYGPKFHGRPTANGERFDMNRISAAHRTLPMPVHARVTNLENGRSIVVRINDRGPFARGRIIDLSRRAAEVLGFLNQGTARVQVDYVGPAPMNPTEELEEKVYQKPVVQQRPLSETSIYIQIGAFGDPRNAEYVKQRLSHLGSVWLQPVQRGGRTLQRVRLGPVARVDQADQLLARVIEEGYPEARILVEEWQP